MFLAIQLGESKASDFNVLIVVESINWRWVLLELNSMYEIRWEM